MSLIIGIAGAHSTGKSTFVQRLTLRLSELGYSAVRVGDFAAAAKNAGFPTVRDHTFASTLWIIARVIQLELEAARQVDVAIVERPVPDALGYLFAALRCRGESLPPRDHEYLFDLARHHSQRYAALYLTELDPRIPIDTSKPRDLDPVFRELAARQMTEVFTQMALAPRVVTRHNLDELVEDAASVIVARH